MLPDERLVKLLLLIDHEKSYIITPVDAYIFLWAVSVMP